MNGSRARWCIREMLFPVSGAACAARDVITEACVRWEMPGLLGPASLVVSELVTNAVQHAGTIFDLQLGYGRRYLLIEVGDGSKAIPRMAVRSATGPRLPLPCSGYGLQIVEATADHWGWRHIDGGKVVWAALRHHVPRPGRLARR